MSFAAPYCGPFILTLNGMLLKFVLAPLVDQAFAFVEMRAIFAEQPDHWEIGLAESNRFDQRCGSEHAATNVRVGTTSQ